MMNRCKDFTPEEDQYIIDNYATDDEYTLCTTLKRNWRQVVNRAAHLRLDGVYIPSRAKFSGGKNMFSKGKKNNE